MTTAETRRMLEAFLEEGAPAPAVSPPPLVVGCDEAGVGALLGDLVACACALPAGFQDAEVMDSKRLRERRRDRVGERLRQSARFGLGIVTAAEIDQAGMARARRDVFTRALDDFAAKYGTLPQRILVDGTLFEGWREVPFECHVRGDERFACISAASIIAKTERDARVRQLVRAEPTLSRYGVETNKGYPTPQHKRALGQLGHSEHHRKTFRF